MAAAAALELDDAILHLRFNEPTIGTWVLTTVGDPDAVCQAEELFGSDADHWLVREVRLLWARTLKRLDVSARTLVALIEPGSCFAGDARRAGAGRRPRVHARRARRRRQTIAAGDAPTDRRQRRLVPDVERPHRGCATRFWGRDDALATAAGADRQGPRWRPTPLDAELVTFALDDLDWDDEVRVMLEERNSFSPDALTGMEANLRFVGPETMETKIFARLSAWQNWIFQRPNAVGPEGALRSFGTGSRPTYDQARV